MTIIAISFVTGVSAFAFGWVMRGREIPSLIREAKAIGIDIGYRKGLETPTRPLIKPQAPTQ